MLIKKHTCWASRTGFDAYRNEKTGAGTASDDTQGLRCSGPVLAGLMTVGALLAVSGCVAPRDCFAGAPEIQALECQASRGDKAAQLAFAERLEAGDGVAADPARAARLYRQAAASTSGSRFIYVPGVDKKPGYVLPVRSGPDRPGLVEAQYRLGLMYLEGRGVGADRNRGLSLIRRAAKAGSAQAKAELEAMGEGL